jgi:hypothetical protein
MIRHRLSRDLRGHAETSTPSRGFSVRGSWVELPPMHSGGHDHILGGGGIAAAFVPSPDPVIDLADGTRITFATAGVSPRL